LSHQPWQEHLGIPDRLREVVSQLRALDYAMTQEIDPGSHMNIWKADIAENCDSVAGQDDTEIKVYSEVEKADSTKDPRKKTPVRSEEAVA
jgi:hypothetical protein